MLYDFRNNTLSDFYGQVRPGFDDRRESDVNWDHFVIEFRLLVQTDEGVSLAG